MKKTSLILAIALHLILSGCQYEKTNKVFLSRELDSLENESMHARRKDSIYVMNEYHLGELYESFIWKPEKERIMMENALSARTHYVNALKHYTVAPEWLTEQRIYSFHIKENIERVNDDIYYIHEKIKIEKAEKARDRWEENVKKYGYKRRFFPTR